MTTILRHDEVISDYLVRLQQRLALLDSAPEELSAIARAGLEFCRCANIESTLTLFIQMKFVSEQLLEAIVSGGNEYRPYATHFIWERLAASGVVTNAVGQVIKGGFADHALNIDLLRCHLRDDTFLNLFTRPCALSERYSDALVAIDVYKEGVERRGSGFIVKAGVEHFVVTCAHNVVAGEGIEIKAVTTARGDAVLFSAPIVLDGCDLALLKVRGFSPSVSFRLGRPVQMFEEVYTLGFPALPGAYPALVGHRGEVNGHIKLYLDPTPAILISNLVSPGSSGCAVLLPDGHCVGMTMRWIEGEWEAERVRFSVALPSSVLYGFVSKQLG